MVQATHLKGVPRHCRIEPCERCSAPRALLNGSIPCIVSLKVGIYERALGDEFLRAATTISLIIGVDWRMAQSLTRAPFVLLEDASALSQVG